MNFSKNFINSQCFIEKSLEKNLWRADQEYNYIKSNFSTKKYITTRDILSQRVKVT